MSRILRRGVTLVAAASALALITGCAASPGSSDAPPGATPMDVAVFLPTAEFAGNFVADDKGYYADAGLDVNIAGGGANGPAPEVLLASDEAQIAYESNTSRLFNYMSGADDLVMLGVMFQQTPNGLLSLKERPVRDTSELEGASIISLATNRSSVDALMQINGVSDYSFVPGGIDIGALQAGQGDALISFATNQPVALEQQGLKPGEDFYFTPFSDLGYYLLADVILVKRDYLAENREAVVAYLEATAKGWEDVFEDPEYAAEITATKYGAALGLDPAQQAKVLEAQIPYMQSEYSEERGLFALDPEYISEKVYPSLEAAGQSDLPEVSSIVDPSVLEDAQ